MRIGVFGGGFDPPHYGHMWVISCVLNSGEVDQVWVVPSGSRRDKTTIAPGWARAEMMEKMLAICFNNDDRLQVCTAEIEEGSTVEGTVELVEELNKRAGDVEFKIIIGSDLLDQLPHWRHVEQLKQYQFLVITRPGGALLKPEGFHIREIHTPISLDIAAHQLRVMLRDQQQVAGLIPREIVELAKGHYSR